MLLLLPSFSIITATTTAITTIITATPRPLRALRLNLFFLFSFLISGFCFQTPAHAACFNPAGSAGNVLYNGGYRTFQYCNGGSWQKMGGAGDTASNLVGWWKLDDGAGTSAADSSGAGNTGTLVNTPTWTTSGMNNGALTFNGTTQWVNVPEAASLQLSGSWTVSAWVNLSALPTSGNTEAFVVKTGYYSDINYAIGVSNGGYGCAGVAWVGWYQVYPDGWSGAACYQPSAITTGTWYHVAATWDGTTVTLYVNGAQVAQSVTGTVPATGAGYMSIGQDYYGNSGAFTSGTIDDVRVYNRALTATDVMTLYGSTGGSYPGTPVSSLTQGGNDACGIAGGALYCWGANPTGEDGTGDTSQHYTPAQVGSLRTWTSVTQADPIFGTSACGIAGGNLYCWGLNGNGQLGLGNTTQYTSPQQVTTPSTTWTAVSSGGFDTCGITTAGALYCWGINGNGQLGLGNTTQYTSPQQVTSPSTTWTAVSTNGYATCGITTAGALYCWGNNNQGELGLGNYTQYTTPQQVTSPSTTWTVISQGDGATCGITTGGALYCWGTSVGINSSSPQQVGSLTNWTAISIDNDGSNPADACGIAGGKLYCWGVNSDGEDGLGNTTQYTTPQQVGSLTNWTAVSQGGTDTCGIAGGALYCWGWNHFYEDGLGNYTQQTTPQLVSVGAGAGGCLNPTGSMGNMIYNAGTYHVLQYCDGSVWQPMGKVPGAGGGGCSSPAGSEGHIIYSSAYRVIQYCDGTTWRAAGRTIPITGLVGWWNFDEGSGTSAADSSGNSNTGTLTNGPTWTTGGKINSALGFVAASTQYVSVPYSSIFDFATGSFTVSAWMKANSLPATQHSANAQLVGKQRGDESIGWTFQFHGSSGTGNADLWLSDGAGHYTTYTNSTPLSLSVWYHLVFIVDRSTNTLRSYVNGIKDGTEPSIVSYGNVDDPDALFIGAERTDGLSSFDGTIDDVRIYNRALSASEVWRLYNGAP
jgi:alpha-tubulin suppressor-like RCC1 family protein